MKSVLTAIILLLASAVQADYLAWNIVTNATNGTTITGVEYEVEIRSLSTGFEGINIVVIEGDPVYFNTGTNCTWDISGMTTGVTYRIWVWAVYTGQHSDPGTWAEGEEDNEHRIPPPYVEPQPTMPPVLAWVLPKGSYYTLFECTDLVTGDWLPVPGYATVRGDNKVHTYTPVGDLDSAFYEWRVVE